MKNILLLVVLFGCQSDIEKQLAIEREKQRAMVMYDTVTMGAMVENIPVPDTIIELKMASMIRYEFKRIERFTASRIISTAGYNEKAKTEFEIRYGETEETVDTIFANGRMHFVIMGGYEYSEDSYQKDFNFVKDPTKGRWSTNWIAPYERVEVGYASRDDLDNQGKIVSVAFFNYWTVVLYN